MECFLCLEVKQDIVDCISMNSTTWDELQVQSIIEKHLWATIMVESKSQWLCLTCWSILQEFHKFYIRIENAQIKSDCIIKKELDSYSEIEYNNLKSVELENIQHQTTIDFVKEEAEVYDNDYNDDVPLIQIRKCVDREDLTKNYFLTSEMHNDPTMAVISAINNRQENEDIGHVIKSDPDMLQVPKENETKSSLKYFYKSRTSCRDYDKFIAEHFNLTCSNCEESFDTFSELKSHIHDIHNKRGCVVCCKTKFYNRGSLVDHINCHLNPKYFKCEFCSKVLKLRKTFVNHMRSHKRRPYCCNICNEKFQRKCCFEYHTQQHVLSEDKKFPCTECNLLFASEYLLSNHVEVVHLKKYSIQCNICGKSMSNVETCHKQQYDNTEPSVSCDTCGLVVSSKHYLKIHMNLEHPTEENQERVCHICQRVSLTVNALRQHIRRNHRIGFIHKCTMCEKSFKRLDHLKLHLNVHMGAGSSKRS